MEKIYILSFLPPPPPQVAVGDEVDTNIADLELYTGMLNT